MRILSLNTWHGQIRPAILDFLEREAARTDVFCLQEILDTPTEVREENGYYLAFLRDLLLRLPEFDAHPMWMIDGPDPDGDVSVPIRYGIVTLTRKSLPPDTVEGRVILGTLPMTAPGRHPRVALATTWRDHDLTIVNVHGVPGDGKRDTPDRLAQSDAIRAIVEQCGTRWIVIGDFNLSPDTESLARIVAGATEYVTATGAQTTRSARYEKREALPFADYAVVSPGITTRSFEVLDVEVSDHLPLRLEIVEE